MLNDELATFTQHEGCILPAVLDATFTYTLTNMPTFMTFEEAAYGQLKFTVDPNRRRALSIADPIGTLYSITIDAVVATSTEPMLVTEVITTTFDFTLYSYTDFTDIE